MESIIQDQKQMIKYLHKQAQDHVKTREMLTEMNEELEKDIYDKDQENEQLKKELGLKNEKVEAYEEEFRNVKNEKDHLEKLIRTLQKELRSNEIEYHRKVKEMEDDLNFSNSVQKVDK